MSRAPGPRYDSSAMGVRHEVHGQEIGFAKGETPIEFKSDNACILYGVQWGERSLRCEVASMAGRPLPGHAFAEHDGNQCFLFPAVFVPPNTGVAFVFKATKPTGDYVQFLAAFDKGAAEWVERRKQERQSLIHL